MPSAQEVQRDLDATAKLIEAMRSDPRLLNDEEFNKRFLHVCDKHAKMVKYLERKLGVREISPIHLRIPSPPSGIKSYHSDAFGRSPNAPYCHQGHSGASESTYDHLKHTEHSSRRREHSETVLQRDERYEDVVRNSESSQRFQTRKSPLKISPAAHSAQIHVDSRNSKTPRDQNSREMAMKRASSVHSRFSNSDIQDILKEAMVKHFAGASTSSDRLQKPVTSSGVPTRQLEPEKGRLRSAKQSHIPTSSAMPSGLLMANALTKHVPRRQNLATSSNVVEESFLDDGLSTTRDAPTIVDEIVQLPEKDVRKTAKPVNTGKTVKTVHLEPVNLPKRSKSMQNVSVPRNEYIPQTTVPKPFQLSLRKSIENTYAKKFVSTMMEEKKKQEETDANTLKSVKFRAKPVPKSTYAPTNTFATEIKYVEAMRRKVERMAKRKFDAQNEMVRSKSEGNLTAIKPPGYVPPSTYISPIPVKPNARSRSATTRSAILIQEATTPKGIKSHRHTSNLTHQLRHGRCKLDTSAVAQHRRMSPPDFQKIHAKVKETYNHLSGRPSTVPVPFKFASRSHSASMRHTNCKEKEPEQFKKSQNGSKRVGSGRPARVPSTHAAQLREELNRAKIEKEKAENGGNSGEFWKEDNRKRIASFLGARSKTDEDIAIRTRRKIQQQQETTQDYMRQLAEMKQRVLSGPLIMEKQSALAQEHRLKRKFAARMKSAAEKSLVPQKASESRRMSETSAAGTFVVEKEYAEDFEEDEEPSKGEDDDSDEDSESDNGSESSESESGEKSGSGSQKSEKSEDSDDESSEAL